MKSEYGKRAKEGYSGKEYEKNWIKIFGKKCPTCKGKGHVPFFNKEGDFGGYDPCDTCNGSGRIEK